MDKRSETGPRGWIGSIERYFDGLLTALGALVGLSIGLFAVSIPIDLAMRLAGWGNIPWLNEVIEYSLYVGVFLAAPWVLRLNAHVRVDLVLSSLPKAWSRWLERFIDLLGLAVCAALLWIGLVGMAEAYESGSVRRATLVVHHWWIIALFCFSMLLLAIEFLFRLFHSAADIDREAGYAEKSGF